MYSKDVLDYAKEQESEVSRLEYRVHPPERTRSFVGDDLMRDYARVLYSSSFRRLQGKMQLLGVDANAFNRNRLTHSLEVAQIARSIAQNLDIEKTVVAETASLAHDIGNPPFGHSGERVLNELGNGCGGYEGNAQAFRILHTLEKKHHSYDGLNLNVRTLMAVTKYFYKRKESERKFLYDSDYEFLEAQLAPLNIPIKKSIDAQIMDLADEIAYAAHDLEDAISFGLISLGEMLHEFKISKEFSRSYDQMEDIAKEVQRSAMKAKRCETSEEYLIVLKKELTSEIVNRLCCDIGLESNQKSGKELGYNQYEGLAKGLKKLLFNAILRKKDVLLYERRGEKIIRGLFEVYSDEKYNKGNLLLPPELRAKNECKTRLIIDYISGMMDSYAAQEYERYFGIGSANIIY